MQPISALLRASWAFYKERFGTFIGISIIPQAVVFVLSFLVGIAVGVYEVSNGATEIDPSLVVIAALIGFLLFFLVSSWGQIALILAFKEKIGIKEAYKRAWSKIVSYWWVTFLATLFMAGAFLLLFIPAIIISVWFSMALYVFLLEEKKGMAALYMSREYVRGHFDQVFWRLFAFSLLMMVIFIVSAIVFGLLLPAVSDIVQIVLTTLLTPFMFIYCYLVYKNLREIKGDVVATPTRGEKSFYVVAGLLGVLMVIALAAGLFWAALNLPELSQTFEDAAKSTGSAPLQETQ